jgi:uncharacterized protein DUF5670
LSTAAYALATISPTHPIAEEYMMWLAAILVIAWLLGWGVFHVAGGLIHLLLVVALVVFVFNLVSGRRAGPTV